MKRIILHWTGGTYQPNELEYEHYHYLITGDALLIKGKYEPEDNINCYDGKYAAHTGGGNTGSIGIAYCGMFEYVHQHYVGNYPIKPAQLEFGFLKIAEIAKQYNIPIDEDHIMTHYEFGLKHPTTSSRGKIDLSYLPPYKNVSKEEAGNFIRQKIKWYQERL